MLRIQTGDPAFEVMMCQNPVGGETLQQTTPLTTEMTDEENRAIITLSDWDGTSPNTASGYSHPYYWSAFVLSGDWR